MANVKKPIIQTPANSNKKISDELVVHGDEIGYTSIYKIIQTLQHSIEEIQQNIEQIQNSINTENQTDTNELYSALNGTVSTLMDTVDKNKSAIDENINYINQSINNIQLTLSNIYLLIDNNSVVKKTDVEFLHNFSPFSETDNTFYPVRVAAIFTYTMVVNLVLTLYNKNVIDVSDIENIKTATQQLRLIDINE